MFLPVGFQVYFRQFCFLLAVQGLFVGIAVLEVVRRGGLPGVSRTALKAVFQAACLVARCSSSTSLGVLYPRAEWSRF